MKHKFLPVRGQMDNMAQNRQRNLAHVKTAMRNLSSFNGNDAWYGTDGGFYGADGDFYGADGGQSTSDLSQIKAAEAEGRFFQFAITNANATAEQFYLNYGVYAIAGDRGAIAEGAFLSIAGNNLAGAGFPSSISKFNRFLQQNPGKIVGIRMSSTVAAQMDTNISVDVYNPFKQGLLNQQAIPLQRYRNEYVYQNNILTLPIVVDFNNQTVVTASIVANSTLTITVFFDKVLNTSKALATAAQ